MCCAAAMIASYRNISSTEEISPESSPINMPSTTNGMRTNAFVAPTDFIILISNLLAYIVMRIVFEMINREIIPKIMTTQSPMVATRLLRLVSFSATSLRLLILSTPSICWISLAVWS